MGSEIFEVTMFSFDIIVKVIACVLKRMVTKTRLPNYNLSYKTRDLLKEFGNKISERKMNTFQELS